MIKPFDRIMAPDTYLMANAPGIFFAWSILYVGPIGEKQEIVYNISGTWTRILIPNGDLEKFTPIGRYSLSEMLPIFQALMKARVYEFDPIKREAIVFSYEALHATDSAMG